MWRAASLGIRPKDGPKLGNGKPEPLQMKLCWSGLAGAQVWLVPGTTIQGRAFRACCQGAVLEVGTALLCLLGCSNGGGCGGDLTLNLQPPTDLLLTCLP